VKKHYPARGRARLGVSRIVKAVDGVSLAVEPGEVVALVGESGCGKSTLGRLALRLLEPTSGRVSLFGVDITHLRGNRLKPIRRLAQMVFQDPFGSLNPRMTVGAAVAYPLRVNGVVGRGDRAELERRVSGLLERVGLSAAHARRLPHELSGGQRQRVGIARAIALEPKLLVLDEPVAALDLSAQALVLNLFKELQRELGMAYLFVTHDLGVAEYMADRMVVMYAGKIVEAGGRAEIFGGARHPYTQALISAAVLGERGDAPEIVLEGDPPSPLDPPTGCRFHPRCPHAAALCIAEEPQPTALGAGRLAACHLVSGRIGPAEP
jgi:oligopeptide/dipeptide ABC transporter ATP-binding protein